MLKRLLLVWLLLGSGAGADRLSAHRALLGYFWPEATESQIRESLPVLPEPWVEQLEPLLERYGPAGTLGRLTGSSDAGQRQMALLLRRSYIGYIYGGQRGYAMAGLKAPDSKGAEPRKPLLKRRTLPSRYDYLVIGSGPAGSVIAHQLTRRGFQVALLERGSFVLPQSMDTRLVGRLKLGGGAVPSRQGRVLVRNAVAVGGGSTVNVDLAFPPTLPSVNRRIQSWDWPALGPEPIRAAYAWVEKAIGTRTPPFSEVNANNLLLWEGARQSGLEPALYDLNTWPPGEAPPVSDKRSSVESLIYEALAENLVLLPDTEVREIVVEEGRAVGVLVEQRPGWDHPGVWRDPYELKIKPGTQYQIRASRVVLCAGAQGSAAILKRSGLGGPQVGRGLVLHPSIPLIGRFDRPINNLEGTASTVYCEDPELDVIYECMSAGPDYVAQMLLGSGREIAERIRDFSHLGGFGVLLVDDPIDSNHLSLDDRGEPVVDYRLSPSQKSRFAKGVRKAAEMLFLAGAREVYVPTTEDLLGDGRPQRGELLVLHRIEQAAQLEKLSFVSGRTVVTSAHFQSSCKMGQVVDPHFRVAGVEGLYLCDSSVFPTSVGANPMQTIYTVARIFATTLE